MSPSVPNVLYSINQYMWSNPKILSWFSVETLGLYVGKNSKTLAYQRLLHEGPNLQRAPIYQMTDPVSKRVQNLAILLLIRISQRYCRIENASDGRHCWLEIPRSTFVDLRSATIRFRHPQAVDAPAYDKKW